LIGSIGDGSFLFGELSLGLIDQARIESAVRMDQDFFAGFNGQAGLVRYFIQDDWHSSMNLGLLAPATDFDCQGQAQAKKAA
jgi:hypothetical protein